MVNIDTVYQNVLALANKEQRGYITPQEFNLFADQAQMEIFEQYFYDLNQWSRQLGNSSKYGDMLTILNEKIDIFKNYDVKFNTIPGTNGAISLNDFNLSGDAFTNIQDTEFYRINMVSVRYANTDTAVIAEEQSRGEQSVLYSQSPLAMPTRTRPRYTRFDAAQFNIGLNRIEITPPPDSNVDDVFVSYIRTPRRPRWGYNVINGKALLNSDPAMTVNFELHASEQGELIHKILGYSGITIKSQDITSAAMMLENSKLQQEKQ